MAIDRRTLMAATAAALAAPALRNPALAAADELVVGFSYVGTGPLQSLLITNKVPVEMALADINGAGGVNGKKLRVSIFDTAGDPRQAQVAARRFAEDEGALCILGPASSGECRVAFPAGERLGIVQCSHSATAPGITDKMSFAFRNTSDELTQFRRLLKVMKAKGMPVASASILYATDEFISKTLGETIYPQAFKDAGIPVARAVGFPMQAFDVSAQVAEIVRNPTDIVALGGTIEPAVKVLKELRRQGYKGRMIGSGVMSDPTLPEKVGADGEGTLYPSFFYSGLNDRTKAFTERFAAGAKQAGYTRTSPHHTDAAAYDILQIYAEAMRRARVTGEPGRRAAERIAIRDQMKDMEGWGWEGVLGRSWFYPDGAARLPAHVIEVRDGRLQLLDSLYEG
ncbi:ABC transporter substrate-binding protein [Roseomonas marmotae]|uniref:ABC transporter substrate-binding protein n=1 Tax=Roseomonas marmotae TaxID=2768161 RepID=A0ABS3KB25_9PROT|nr:ABC transporter substrate-binding protein [Roseomonas marmotae]MBO1074644.1 ABC transporter substrate-binding protein [Roseomonas marmotae]QTI81664.1 ABC transporter substrate-binding protein [Roseomonas marmotae]